MINTYVFFNNTLLYEYSHHQTGQFQIPTGSYVFYTMTECWYFKVAASLIPINFSDIPKEIKTLCLLLGITI